MGASSHTRAPARAARGADALLAFAAAMARGRQGEAGRALQRARRAGWPRRAAEETALMLVLHAGYPAALEALAVLAHEWPGAPHRAPERGPARRRRDGARLCRRVYGGTAPRLIENVRRLHPSLARWMIEEGYGRVLSRPGLGAVERELVAVAVLAACGWERQLVSHLLGAARVGAPRERVGAAFAIGRRMAETRARAGTARAWRRAFGAPSRGAAVDRPRARS